MVRRSQKSKEEKTIERDSGESTIQLGILRDGEVVETPRTKERLRLE